MCHLQVNKLLHHRSKGGEKRNTSTGTCVYHYLDTQRSENVVKARFETIPQRGSCGLGLTYMLTACWLGLNRECKKILLLFYRQDLTSYNTQAEYNNQGIFLSIISPNHWFNNNFTVLYSFWMQIISSMLLFLKTNGYLDLMGWGHIQLRGHICNMTSLWEN